ncbi:TPA: helix-turn-helix domain-containing protein [Escherichia coli]|nr:helix-turn-helix domain-containing protein [Escherichia coli]HEI2953018.1 helix-turn-helix domain-containing protein [Escherichia coli]
MAKPPSAIPLNTPSSCDVSAIPSIIQQFGLINFNISCNNGELTIMGADQNGTHIRVNSYQGNGFTEGTMSTFQPRGKEARRLEAIRLRKSGLTQQEIANRLGVSQKTISNDLK